jgi:thiamine biosynthesis lipoprotein
MHRLSAAVMGTVVSIDVVTQADDDETRAVLQAYLDSAMEWFYSVEASCTRFDPSSELMQLTNTVGTPTRVSPLVFEAVRFALTVADESAGAFDPTVGHVMSRRGFDREHRSGRQTPPRADVADEVSFRDVALDEREHTITLARPLILDLGAVAKGLAIDLAVRELSALEHFAIDAGGDTYLSGHNRSGEPWAVGIRHPGAPDELIETWRVSNLAVCTSGGYLRRTTEPGEHHILDPRVRRSPGALASVTVVAESAMVADALATAGFVLGPDEGLEWLERQSVRALMITPALERIATQGFHRDSTILPDAERSADHRAGDRHGAGRGESDTAADHDRPR